ncbi:MAG TPA: 2-C-methyl-D-erythritol 2,4-cyclodiphosphate synthase [Actinomycetota bacterium]|nr:2-C-methyl-D-erythritol 2,4-cyclodiphosphate synthase [Actinomycetota bacterium]
MRVGIGYDAHAFAAERKLILGGVLIRDHDGLAGHSDADVIVHAIADALLGAAGLGDLGDFFPADEKWKDASGFDLLKEVAALLSQDGWVVGNIDATVIAEAPRLAPHRDQMRANIATALSLGREDVSIKATTTDGVGFVGRGEGMAAVAVASLRRARS